MLCTSCSAAPASRPRSEPCVPSCERTQSCGGLDARLLAARAPLLACVGENARGGRLAEAHRCYRALRFLESARWWLITLTGPDEMSSVYQPSESIRLEFLCRIEQLARAKTAAEVERLYLETIQSYP
jgi:hypothetical protein